MTKKPLPQILPCPWNGCTKEPWLVGDECGGYWVQCDVWSSHQINGPLRATELEATEAWNAGVKE